MVFIQALPTNNCYLGAPGDESSTDIAQYDESLPSYDDPAADSLAGYANGDGAGAAGSNPAGIQLLHWLDFETVYL